jgi:hypothetical protein
VAIVWNDIEILQVLDDSEQSNPGAMYNGYVLAQATAGRRGAALGDQDSAGFVRELFVLLEAGLLQWRVPGSIGGMPPPDPRHPHEYLQRIQDLALTIAGRDRARGQIVRVPLPDPAEDDGRMIRASTLDDVARQIGEGYTPPQAARLLIEAGVSPLCQCRVRRS